jgi:Protein of unknown function (DUF2934)
VHVHPQPAAIQKLNPEQEHREIAKLAYSYWEARGRQGGSQAEDWRRAEHEFRSRQK